MKKHEHRLLKHDKVYLTQDNLRNPATVVITTAVSVALQLQGETKRRWFGWHGSVKGWRTSNGSPVKIDLEKRHRSARDYPALSAWLDRFNARRLWHMPIAGRSIEAWQLHGGRGILVEVHPNGHGWDLWSNEATNSINETFAAVEKRYDLQEPN